MGGLNASLAVAVSGLTADQGALEATANNVANVNTPGYSREVPVLEAGYGPSNAAGITAMPSCRR